MRRSLLHRAREAGKTPFVRGVAMFQIGSVIMLFTGFASSVLYARLLGLKGFGLYSIISASMGLLTIVTAYGQETAMTTFLAEAVGKKDKTAIADVLRYYAQATAASSTVLLLLAALAPTIGAWFHWEPAIGQYGRLVLLNTLLQPPMVILFAALQIERRVGTVVLLENGADIVQLILCTVLLLFGWGVQGLLFGIFIVSATSLPLMLWLYNRSAARQGFPGIWQILRTIGQGNTGPYLRQGLWIALDQNVSKNLYPNVFYVLLNAFAPLEVVGIFRLAMRLAALPFSVITPSITRMTNIAIPRMIGENPTKVLSSLKKVLIGTIGLGILASVASAIVIPPLIPLVYGSTFVRAGPVFVFLLIPNLLASTHVLSVPLLRVFRRVWIMSGTNILGVLLGLGGASFLLSLGFSTLWSVSVGILLFHINMLLLFAFVFILLRKQRLTRRASAMDGCQAQADG